MQIMGGLKVPAHLLCLSACACGLRAQQTVLPAGPVATTPPTITLERALSLAEAAEPALARAAATSKVAGLDRSIARAALLPTVTYHNAYLYTQPNGGTNQAGSSGTQAAPRFIANNAVHEYANQAVVNETLGLRQWTAVAQASAAAAIADAELAVSRRGLRATVVALFYASATTEDKVQIEERAAAEARSFVAVTTQRETQREAAHSEVLKAQLTLQQRERDVADASLARDKARLELGVLLFADPRTAYSLAAPDALPLASRNELEQAAASNNPELNGAVASLRAANLDVKSARTAYLPDASLNYTYGIDAEQFAVNGPAGIRNLGYSASATLDLPIFDWLATHHRVRQAQVLRDAAKIELTATQRRLIAQLAEFYDEAAVAERQLTSLQLTVDTARESLRLTRLRYGAGESTVLEVVDAQSTLTSAELGQVDGSARYHTALANLQLLTGAP